MGELKDWLTSSASGLFSFLGGILVTVLVGVYQRFRGRNTDKLANGLADWGKDWVDGREEIVGGGKEGMVGGVEGWVEESGVWVEERKVWLEDRKVWVEEKEEERKA